MQTKKHTYLIAHTSGTDIAQASIRATSERAARHRFADTHHDRIITVVGIKGDPGKDE